MQKGKKHLTQDQRGAIEHMLKGGASKAIMYCVLDRGSFHIKREVPGGRATARVAGQAAVHAQGRSTR